MRERDLEREKMLSTYISLQSMCGWIYGIDIELCCLLSILCMYNYIDWTHAALGTQVSHH